MGYLEFFIIFVGIQRLIIENKVSYKVVTAFSADLLCKFIMKLNVKKRFRYLITLQNLTV